MVRRSCKLLSRLKYNTCGIARERIVGWYHTGPKLRASDLEINELFKRFVSRPVMVIVDVRPHTVGIPTDAYFGVEEIKDVRVFFIFIIQYS
jgi:proteasome lid subunit RPN8/RPN11